MRAVLTRSMLGIYQRLISKTQAPRSFNVRHAITIGLCLFLSSLLELSDVIVVTPLWLPVSMSFHLMLICSEYKGGFCGVRVVCINVIPDRITSGCLLSLSHQKSNIVLRHADNLELSDLVNTRGVML